MKKKPNRNNGPRADDKTTNILLIVAVILVLITLALYVWQFDGALSNNQDFWGSFGDYFGGVIGPFLSFIALLVLVKTLHLQRREWQEARSQARVDRLVDFAKHVYEEFDNLLDQKIRLKIKPGTVEFNQAALAANDPPPPIQYDDLEDSTLRKLFNVDSRAFPDNVVDKKSLEKIIRPDGASEWDRHYHIHVGKMIKLIMELNGLLRAINLETGSVDVGAFYINRCRPVTCAIAIVGYIPLVKMSKICPFLTIETYGKQGPIKWRRVGDKFVREDETGF